MELPDGRELAWLETGKPRGFPVFAFHGTPGSRRQVAFDEKAIAASGVRMIAPDRPGYGHSSYHPDRTLTDWAADVAALADHLKIERLAVAGLSGGGPHAAACAALLPERVAAAGIVSGVGPLERARTGRSDGRPQPRVDDAGSRAPVALRPIFAVQDFAVRRWPERTLRGGAEADARPADAAVLEQADVVEAMVIDAQTGSGDGGVPAAQDFVLFAPDWGFRLQDITVPGAFLAR